MAADGERHSWLPVWHMCLLKYQKSTEQNLALHCKIRSTACQFGYEVGKWCGPSAVVSDVRAPLDKLFVSAEGRNMRLCRGFEVQINVRREVSAWCCEGKDGGGVRVGLEDWGTWNINDIDFLSWLSPSKPCCLRPLRNSKDGAVGQCLVSGTRPVVCRSLGAHDFRVMGSCLRRGPAASLQAAVGP